MLFLSEKSLSEPLIFAIFVAGSIITITMSVPQKPITLPILLLSLALVFAGCNAPFPGEQPSHDDNDTTRLPQDSVYQTVHMQTEVTSVQPMTGLVLWPDHAQELNSTYGKSVALEFSYCLPCKVVKGKKGDKIEYDWTSFDALLQDIASRNHQAVIRFRYEYPNSTDVDGKRGTTAVPDYIKALPGYSETYSKNPGGDGPTYYADWRNAELQWFTKQFYTDFNLRYADDPRIAFLEVGFGHWSEYHIYGTKLQLGVNFPSKAYQKEFFLHMAQVMDIPWLVSVDAADDSYTPVVGDAALTALNFGLFDDSFMHENHDLWQGEGYNEECWNAIGKPLRWQRGVCGGEISYYTDKDQRNFLNPAGLYGITWEQAADKYHITFMIANDAPAGPYGTAARFREAGMFCGYRFKVLDCRTKEGETQVLVKNIGIAPLYRDAYFAIADTQSEETLRGLLPGEKKMVTIPVQLLDASDLHIRSKHILKGQQIEFSGNF